MLKIIPNPPAGFDALSVNQQIDYAQSLRDRIAANPEQVPVPEWHRRIIREHLMAYYANPSACRPWHEDRTSIERNLRDR